MQLCCGIEWHMQVKKKTCHKFPEFLTKSNSSLHDNKSFINIRFCWLKATESFWQCRWWKMLYIVLNSTSRIKELQQKTARDQRGETQVHCWCSVAWKHVHHSANMTARRRHMNRTVIWGTHCADVKEITPWQNTDWRLPPAKNKPKRTSVRTTPTHSRQH